MFDVGSDFGVDKGQFTGSVCMDRNDTKELDCGNTERTDRIPDTDSLDGNICTSELALQ